MPSIRQTAATINELSHNFPREAPNFCGNRKKQKQQRQWGQHYINNGEMQILSNLDHLTNCYRRPYRDDEIMATESRSSTATTSLPCFAAKTIISSSNFHMPVVAPFNNCLFSSVKPPFQPISDTPRSRIASNSPTSRSIHYTASASKCSDDSSPTTPSPILLGNEERSSVVLSEPTAATRGSFPQSVHPMKHDTMKMKGGGRRKDTLQQLVDIQSTCCIDHGAPTMVLDHASLITPDFELPKGRRLPQNSSVESNNYVLEVPPITTNIEGTTFNPGNVRTIVESNFSESHPSSDDPLILKLDSRIQETMSREDCRSVLSFFSAAEHQFHVGKPVTFHETRECSTEDVCGSLTSPLRWDGLTKVVPNYGKSNDSGAATDQSSTAVSEVTVKTMLQNREKELTEASDMNFIDALRNRSVEAPRYGFAVASGDSSINPQKKNSVTVSQNSLFVVPRTIPTNALECSPSPFVEGTFTDAVVNELSIIPDGNVASTPPSRNSLDSVLRDKFLASVDSQLKIKTLRCKEFRQIEPRELHLVEVQTGLGKVPKEEPSEDRSISSSNINVRNKNSHGVKPQEVDEIMSFSEHYPHGFVSSPIESPSLPPRSLPLIPLKSSPPLAFRNRFNNNSLQSHHLEQDDRCNLSQEAVIQYQQNGIVTSHNSVLDDPKFLTTNKQQTISSVRVQETNSCGRCSRTQSPVLISNLLRQIESHTEPSSPLGKFDWLCTRGPNSGVNTFHTIAHDACQTSPSNASNNCPGGRVPNQLTVAPFPPLFDREVATNVFVPEDSAVRKISTDERTNSLREEKSFIETMQQEYHDDKNRRHIESYEPYKRSFSNNHRETQENLSNEKKDVTELVDKRFHHDWLSFCRRQTIARAYEIEHDLRGPALSATTCNASRMLSTLDSFPPPLSLRQSIGNNNTPIVALQDLCGAKPSSKPSKRPTHFVALRVDNPVVVKNVYNFQKSILRKAPHLKPCAINPAKLHISLLILCLENHEVPIATEAITAAINQFREERRIRVASELAEYLKTSVEHNTSAAEEHTTKQISSPPQKNIALDFNVVGTFGTRVLFTTTNDVQQKTLQILHDHLVETVVKAGLQVVGLEEESGLTDGVSMSVKAAGKSQSLLKDLLKSNRTVIPTIMNKEHLSVGIENRRGTENVDEDSVTRANLSIADKTPNAWEEYQNAHNNRTTASISLPGTPTSSVVSWDRDLEVATQYGGKRHLELTSGNFLPPTATSTKVGVHAAPPPYSGSILLEDFAVDVLQQSNENPRSYAIGYQDSNNFTQYCYDSSNSHGSTHMHKYEPIIHNDLCHRSMADDSYINRQATTRLPPCDNHIIMTPIRSNATTFPEQQRETLLFSNNGAVINAESSRISNGYVHRPVCHGPLQGFPDCRGRPELRCVQADEVPKSSISGPSYNGPGSDLSASQATPVLSSGHLGLPYWGASTRSSVPLSPQQRISYHANDPPSSSFQCQQQVDRSQERRRAQQQQLQRREASAFLNSQGLVNPMTSDDLSIASRCVTQQQGFLRLAFSNQIRLFTAQQQQYPYPALQSPVSSAVSVPPPPLHTLSPCMDFPDDLSRRAYGHPSHSFNRILNDNGTSFNSIVGSVPVSPLGSSLHLILNDEQRRALFDTQQQELHQAQYVQELQQERLLQPQRLPSTNMYVSGRSQINRQLASPPNASPEDTHKVLPAFLAEIHLLGDHSSHQNYPMSPHPSSEQSSIPPSRRSKNPLSNLPLTPSTQATSDQLLALYDKSELVGAVCSSGVFYPHLTIMKTSQGLRRIKNRKKKKMLKIFPEYFHDDLQQIGSFGIQECVTLDFLEMTSQDIDGYYHRLKTHSIAFDE